MRLLFCLLSLIATPLQAQDRAGDFDYYVMALSWSPNWCEIEGDDRDSPQCEDGTGLGWILHGLWPQHDIGYPEYCRTNAAPPNRGETAAMADIMGTSGLAWHQWRKHGVCSGLDPDAYFDLSRTAYAAVERPQVLRDLSRPVTLPADVIEEAFLRENPRMRPDQITITCRGDYIQEVRICLTRDLELRSCGRDVQRDCTLSDARFTPVR